ncbi:hypothetical protein AB1Y20_017461 [Prymnesium parvum]|uniref:DNA-directed RNA polymerase subunit n=1 Tax=Prymnesium parvum TaxID=97485 RepID=A0AB34JP61_PRYPA
MAAIDGECRVVFCPECGTLPDEPTHAGSNVECHVCGHTIPSSVFEAQVVVSESRTKRVGDIDVGSATDADRKARATINEACPKCNHPELEYHTMQLRSADEGQTVFYNCVQCGHNFSTNT